jgi:hypothetical protein
VRAAALPIRDREGFARTGREVALTRLREELFGPVCGIYPGCRSWQTAHPYQPHLLQLETDTAAASRKKTAIVRRIITPIT